MVAAHGQTVQEMKNGLPVIICSANRDIQKIAREAGADDYLVKPFDIDALLAKVARYIGTTN